MNITIFGNIRQKWNAFKNNWGEYQKLRRKCSSLWHKTESLRAKLTYNYSGAEQMREGRCINNIFVDVPSISYVHGDISSNSIIESMSVMVTKYCGCFKHDDAAACGCSNKSCPYHKQNAEYCAAMAEYMDAVAQRRAFWTDADKRKTK